ncbi:MAG TPA: hypothetical protein VK842_01480, partial [bacterium]|nr:hypothetical protein [bacterium]
VKVRVGVPDGVKVEVWVMVRLAVTLGVEVAVLEGVDVGVPLPVKVGVGVAARRPLAKSKIPAMNAVVVFKAILTMPTGIWSLLPKIRRSLVTTPYRRNSLGDR